MPYESRTRDHVGDMRTKTQAPGVPFLTHARYQDIAQKSGPDWGLNPGLLDIYQVLYH